MLKEGEKSLIRVKIIPELDQDHPKINPLIVVIIIIIILFVKRNRYTKTNQ